MKGTSEVAAGRATDGSCFGDLAGLSASKLSPDWGFLRHLCVAGRTAAWVWLDDDDIGVRSSTEVGRTSLEHRSEPVGHPTQARRHLP